MTAIVTGATGFIGGHLVRSLAESGEEVRALVRRPGQIGTAPAVRFHHTDFSASSLGLPDDVFAGVDVVYHLAGATRASSDAAFREANVAITTRLLDRVIRASGSHPRFVYVSSQAAAGPALRAVRRSTTSEEPRRESDQAAPIEAYGRSKLAAEQVVLARSAEIPVTIVRPVAVYGPGDRDFLSIFRMLRRGFAVYPGIRDATVATIYVDDLVRGLIGAARSPKAAGGTYFMGNASFATWRSVYRTAADVMGRTDFHELEIPLRLIRVAGVAGDLIGRLARRPPLVSTSKARLAEPRSWTCSSDLAREDFGFEAKTRLQDGLRATYDWYVKSHWL
jgi:dihydroflavonol-4-reductase